MSQLKLNKIWLTGQVSDHFVTILKPIHCSQNTAEKYKSKHHSCLAHKDLKTITQQE